MGGGKGEGAGVRAQGSQGLGSCGHLGGQTVNEAKSGSDYWRRIADWVGAPAPPDCPPSRH